MEYLHNNYRMRARWPGSLSNDDDDAEDDASWKMNL